MKYSNYIAYGVFILLLEFGAGFIYKQTIINEQSLHAINQDQTINDQEIQIMSLSTRLNSSNVKKSQLNSSLIDLTQKHEKLSDDYERLNVEKETLEEVVDSFRQATQQIDELSETNTRLQNEFAILLEAYQALSEILPFDVTSADDLLTYALSDKEDVLTRTRTRCQFTLLEQGHHDVYLFKQYNSNCPSNFHAHFDFKVTELDINSPSVNKHCLFSMTKELGDVRDLKKLGEEALFVYVRRSEGGFIPRLQEITNGENDNSDAEVLSLGIEYYATLSKFETFTLLSIYSDSERTDLIGSASLDLHSSWSYDYLTLANSLGYNDNDAGNSGYIENIVLLQPYPN